MVSESAVSPSAQKDGLPPGTPVYTGEQRGAGTRFRVLDFGEKHLDNLENVDIKTVMKFIAQDSVTWVDCVGLEDVERITKLCQRFRVHPLAIEDIVQTGSRPKMEDYGSFLFFVLKTLDLEDDGECIEVDAEHISLVLGPGYVLTFQERSGDPFHRVRYRLENDVGRVRSSGADYLAYALIDSVIDNYFVELEEFGEHVEDFEDALLIEEPDGTMQRIQEFRTAARLLRRTIVPMREAIGNLAACRSELIADRTQPYLRDLCDHVAALYEGIEVYREMSTGMIALYHSGTAHRMNEAMKVLTVISTVFLPMMFLSGLYGMNFVYMPELKWRYGYFAVLTLMGLSGSGILVYFRVKKWF